MRVIHSLTKISAFLCGIDHGMQQLCLLTPLTVHVEDRREAQAQLVYRPIRLVVLEFAEKRVGVAQRFHYFFHHVSLRHGALKELGVTPNVLFAVT